MLEGLTPPKSNKGCKVSRILDDLEPADVEILNKALADIENWSSQALSNALRERGLEISPASIQRHRSKLCRHE